MDSWSFIKFENKNAVLFCEEEAAACIRMEREPFVSCTREKADIIASIPTNMFLSYFYVYELS